MKFDLRLVTLDELNAYTGLFSTVTADLAANGNTDYLCPIDEEETRKVITEKRVIGAFIGNSLVGAVTFQQGSFTDILRQRFPDATVPDNLGNGIYTSTGIVDPHVRVKGILTGMMQWIVDNHPNQQVSGTIDCRNIIPQKVHAKIESFPAAVINSPSRPPMLFCVRSSTVYKNEKLEPKLVCSLP